MKFALNDKDIDSIKASSDDCWFEFHKLGGEEWALLGHWDEHVTELLTLSKEEWKIIWLMLSKK